MIYCETAYGSLANTTRVKSLNFLCVSFDELAGDLKLLNCQYFPLIILSYRFKNHDRSKVRDFKIYLFSVLGDLTINS